MTTETHYNAPVKNCRTCAHCVPYAKARSEVVELEYSRCAKFATFCRIARTYKDCDLARDWHPAPPPPPPKPRRGILQVILSWFWNKEADV